jgi:protein-tyrosine-phosphatase
MYNGSMAEEGAPEIIKLLSNDLRWRILKALAKSDLRVQEICELLGQPQNLVSYHLQKLSDAGLVLEHPSIADGRETYYGIQLSQVREQWKMAGQSIHAGISAVKVEKYPTPPLRVLFICTHNSARSQMAEGFLRARSRNQIRVYSAGTDPIGVNPLAARVMAERNVDIRYQRSKGLEQFLGQPFDYIITVCDRARENCPAFAGAPVKIHWSIPDPVDVIDPGSDPGHPFRDVADQLSERIDSFLAQIAK